MREIQGKAGFTKSEEYSFEKVGDKVDGTLAEKATLTSKKPPHKTFQKYVIETKDGRNVGFLGSYDLDKKLGELTTGTKVSITLKELAPNPHGGKAMKIYKVLAEDAISAASVIAASRVS